MARSFNPRPNPVLANWDYLYKHQTKAEATLEPYVAKLGVPYRFQHIQWKFILDFALPNEKVAIEVDGDSHSRAKAKLADAERTAWLEERGWKVVRAHNREVLADPAGALNRMMSEANLPYRIDAAA